jgi:hypothetical protein
MKRPQFSLALLLLIVTLCAVLFTWLRLVSEVQRIEQKERDQAEEHGESFMRPDLYKDRR